MSFFPSEIDSAPLLEQQKEVSVNLRHFESIGYKTGSVSTYSVLMNYSS